MLQQADILLYRFRFVFAGVLAVLFLVTISALVTAIGSGTVLANKTSSSTSIIDTSTLDNSNAVTTGVASLVNSSTHFMLSLGTGLYGGCQSITNFAVGSGKTTMRAIVSTVRGIGNGGVFVVRGIGSSAVFVAHGISSGVVFMAHTTASGLVAMFRAVGSSAVAVVHTPGKVYDVIAHGHSVSSIIRPADETKPPVINGETSDAMLAKYNAEQRQQIADLLAAQEAANRGLGGAIVAGDPHHGEYPAKWDNTAQDSQLDSWGMYNRECVSYAAWKVYQTYGHMPYWGGVGNANQWVRNAKAAGIPTGSTPQVHSVAISMRGYYGHAMWVERVSGDMIYVSQYNYDLHGHYSEMWVNSNYFTYIYFK
jgi:surface antigen